jgi:hypothetical protein
MSDAMADAMADATSDAIDESFVPVRSRHAYVVELDGEAVVLDERANRLHLLNHTATLIWNCLDGVVDVRGLATEIGDVLDLPVATVLTDTVAVVRDLGEQGLLEGVEPAPEHR